MGNMVDGVDTYVSRVCEKGIRIKMAFARTTAASILGSHGVVGKASRGGLGFDASARAYWIALGAFHHFSRYGNMTLWIWNGEPTAPR